MSDVSKDFELTQTQLLEISQALKDKILEGLHAPGQEVACLPTYIPGDASPQHGKALILDFGGTNVRAALVALDDGKLTIEKGPVVQAIPVTRGVAFKKDEFLDILGKLIAALEPPSGLPLGYCFSYPADSTTDGDARLIKWTKGMAVENTIDEKVGHMLTEHIAGYTPPVQCSGVTVVNDTIASLMAGTVVEEADGYIGLIVGTGNNMAAILDPDEMTKLPKKLNWMAPLPVNFESGNFTPPHLTSWDDKMDAESDSAQHQRFEKAVSGVYLASVFKAAMPESVHITTDSRKTVKNIFHVISIGMPDVECTRRYRIQETNTDGTNPTTASKSDWPRTTEVR